jgi:hypothetical protein
MAMKFDGRNAVVLIAGLALYQLFGPKIEHLRGLVDSLVIAELAIRAIRLDHLESKNGAQGESDV